MISYFNYLHPAHLITYYDIEINVSCQLHSNAPIAPDGSPLVATFDGTLPHAVNKEVAHNK
jgi:hypothetical protein